MPMKFVEDKLESPEIEVPYFEDARADVAPYYRSDAKERGAKSQVGEELAKLGGVVMAFHEGKFEEQGITRYGYQIEFVYSGSPGVIRVAGLPIKNEETDAKIRKVKVQALLNVRDWLKSSVTSQVFSPGSNPLLPHLLLNDGTTTFADYIRIQQSLPRLDTGTQIVIENEVD